MHIFVYYLGFARFFFPYYHIKVFPKRILINSNASYNGKKTFDFHVLPNCASIAIVFMSFHLWMFKGGVDTFALVKNF